MVLDPRLQQANVLMGEWLGLRERLAKLGYTHAVDFIAGRADRISAQLHEKRWPPVWWRFTSIDADFSSLRTYFFRMASDGMFFGDGLDGYAPERKEILDLVLQLAAKDDELRKNRSRVRSKHEKAT